MPKQYSNNLDYLKPDTLKNFVDILEKKDGKRRRWNGGEEKKEMKRRKVRRERKGKERRWKGRRGKRENK